MRNELMEKIKAGENLPKSSNRPEALVKKVEDKLQTFSLKDSSEKGDIR